MSPHGLTQHMCSSVGTELLLLRVTGFDGRGSRIQGKGFQGLEYTDTGFRDQQFRRLAQRRPSWGLGLCDLWSWHSYRRGWALSLSSRTPGSRKYAFQADTITYCSPFSVQIKSMRKDTYHQRSQHSAEQTNTELSKGILLCGACRGTCFC